MLIPAVTFKSSVNKTSLTKRIISTCLFNKAALNSTSFRTVTMLLTGLKLNLGYKSRFLTTLSSLVNCLSLALKP